jgi:hypothetical protein
VTIGNSAQNASPDNAIEAFCTFAYEEHGLIILPREVIPGEIGRCKVEGREDDAGAYRFFSDGRGGWVQDWSASDEVKYWFYRNGEQLSPEELEEQRRRIEVENQRAVSEREAEHRRVQGEQRRRFDAAAIVTEHPYLSGKKVAAYGLKVAGDKLLIPLRDTGGELWNAQEIAPDGKKHFPWRGKKQGLYHQIGPDPAPDGTAVIVEGYATGASVHEATGHTVLVAFDRTNLKPVALAVRKKWLKANIILAADDDHATERDKGTNPGTNDAMDAALAVNGKVAVPDFKDVTRSDRQSDFNDLADIGGPEAVKRAFETAKKPDDLLADILRGDPFKVYRPWLKQRYLGLKGRSEELFARLRAELKKKVRVTELDGDADEAGEADTAEKEEEKKRTVDRLVSLARDKTELFHTAKRDTYADIHIKGVRQTHPIFGPRFEEWIGYEYHIQEKIAAPKDAIKNALAVLAGYAQYEGEEREVFVRVAGHDGKIYIDLCDPTWNAIEIDAHGWRIIAEPPVRFRRSDGALPLPVPVKGGSIQELRPFLNVSSDAGFVITVGFLLGTFSPSGPYFILVLYGPGGAAKTSTTRILRALIDPRKPLEEALPRDRETLLINASVTYLLCFGNISTISQDQSNDLCTVATGGGFSRRTLYENEDLTLFEACRSIILNGIETFVVRGDLASRTVSLTLDEISDTQRKTEARPSGHVSSAPCSTRCPTG